MTTPDDADLPADPDNVGVELDDEQIPEGRVIDADDTDLRTLHGPPADEPA